MIPKLIHQCWVNGTPDTQRQNNVNSLRNLNKGWQHKLWDESNIPGFIKSVYGSYVLEAYSSINPKYGAARADLFRYLVCYHLGGVYLDIKSLYARPLDTLIKPNDMYLLTGSAREWHQWHIMCRPGNVILAACIADVLNNINNYDLQRDGVGKQAVINLTGPLPYTRAVNRNMHLYYHRILSPFPVSLHYDTIGYKERMAEPRTTAIRRSR